MLRRLSVTLVLVVLLLGSSLPGLAAVAARQESAPAKILRINWGPGVPEIDPQFSHEGQWSISGGLDYEGLTRLDENAQVVPGAAESWELSPDGKTITFHLREGLEYSDGVPVVAADFVYAAERLCSPELNSCSANLLFDVFGCEEWFHSAGDAGGGRGGQG